MSEFQLGVFGLRPFANWITRPVAEVVKTGGSPGFDRSPRHLLPRRLHGRCVRYDVDDLWVCVFRRRVDDCRNRKTDPSGADAPKSARRIDLTINRNVLFHGIEFRFGLSLLPVRTEYRVFGSASLHRPNHQHVLASRHSTRSCIGRRRTTANTQYHLGAPPG